MNKTLSIIMVGFFAVFLAFVFLLVGDSSKQAKERNSLKKHLSRPVLNLPVSQADSSVVFNHLDRNNTKSPQVSAESVYIWDIKNNREFFSLSSSLKRPIASVTKLLTAAIVLDYASPQEEIRISSAAVENEGNAGGLSPGEIINVEALLHAMLMESSNDAAFALAEYVGAKDTLDKSKTPVKKFVSYMNQKARVWGLLSSYFTDPAGLNDTTSFSTAIDVAMLVKNIRENPNYALVWEILKKEEVYFSPEEFGTEHTFTNNNPFIRDLSQSIGGKTGYTEKAGENLALLVKSPDMETELVYVLLGSETRFPDMRALINWINSAYIWEK